MRIWAGEGCRSSVEFVGVRGLEDIFGRGFSGFGERFFEGFE